LTNNLIVDENLHYLEKLCSDYCMSGSEVYGILISKEDEKFPLSYETIKYMVLKDVPSKIIKKIFTLEQLKSILEDTNMRKIKNPDMRKFINSIN
jgi:hypothetical protein